MWRQGCIALLFGIGFCSLFAQSYNQYDSIGRKDGMWIEDDGLYRFITYYKHGEKDGLSFSYLANKISTFCEMRGGKIQGPLYSFNKDILVSKFSDFHYEKTIVPESSFYTNKFASANCYYISYHKNGRIESEGRLFFWGDTPEIDAGEYGLWKYYDEEGNLIKTVEYK